MTETTIPTLYYTLNKDYTRDKAYKTLKNRKIFDLSFCADTIYSPKYKINPAKRNVSLLQNEM